MIILIFVFVVVAGCAVTERTRFYVLRSLAGVDSGAEVRVVRGGRAVGVGPIRLAEYLNRPQIVTRAGTNEFHLAEFDQWVEPLRDNITGVLAQDLGVLLPSNRIFIFPWKSSESIYYQIKVEVLRFDVTSTGDASLIVRWAIVNREDKRMLVRRKSEFHSSAGADGFNAVVAALNETLADFSKVMARAIKDM